MKIGILIYANDAESVWNAFRFGNFARAAGDEVRAFLLGKGVEIESLKAEKFNVKEQVQTFVDMGGKIFACGVCLQLHGLGASEIYSVSSMSDLYEIVKTSDKVISF